MPIPKTTLGLDLGPSSIGWALVDQDARRIIATGVRIFPEGVDNFDTGKEESRNEARRIARGMRRQITRRARRKRALRDALIQAGLWPDDPDEQTQLLRDEDPYALRARALKEELSPHQIGRILLHLNQRRGFKSNRKSDTKDKEVKGMLAEINQNAAEMKEDDFSTLGAWLHDKNMNVDHSKPAAEDRVRSRHLHRDQYLAEFDAIWQAQSKHHPNLLTDKIRYGSEGKQNYPALPVKRINKADLLCTYGIHGIIFFQRKMYWPKSMVGLCELEPKQPRCPRADRAAQRFRLLQEINNLRIIDPDANIERPLSDDERALLLDKLSQTEKMTFDQIRKALGFTESICFNLEKGKRPKLWGVPVDALLANKNVFNRAWYKRPEQEKDSIVRALLDNERDEDALGRQAVREWGLSADQADAMLAVNFPAGYLSLGLQAIAKLLPHMERGLLYMTDDDTPSALSEAGYLRPDQLKRRIFDKLPMLDRLSNAKLGDLPNPVVKRALVELRKLVNAIVREHGKPDAVHVEMTRQIKQGREKRSEYNQTMRENEAKRDEAAQNIRDYGVKVTRGQITKYILWEAQDRLCVYSGKPISIAQLFGGEIEVDHILPYSRSLDDSQGNKVACFRQANADKGQQTPYEWLGDTDPKRYETICQRARKLGYRKYCRFIQKQIDLDQFIARQLTDTAYISKVTAEYLRLLFDRDHEVLGLKGQYTSELRYQWGLHEVLRHDGLDLKNRDDHRHHAVDAIVIALTDRSRLHQLCGIKKAGGVQQTGEALPFPWDNFRDDVQQAVNDINVSHRVQRKVAGKLHEDTFYGPTDKPDEFVVRKTIGSLSPNEIDKIRDDGIRKIVKRRLREHGIEFGRGKKPTRQQWLKALADPENPVVMPSGVPIKKVRVIKSDKTIQPIRKDTDHEAYVKPGSTHHLCIFEWNENGKTKRGAVFTTMLEAISRVKNKQPIIQRKHPERPDAKFVMSLSKGEMVLASANGQELLLTLKTSVSTEEKMDFALHTDARKSDEKKKFNMNKNTMFTKYNVRKVTIDPLGRIRWAND